MVSFDKRNRSCNTLFDSSSRLYLLNKTEHVFLNLFNVITEISESKTLIKYMLCNCTSKFDGKKCNLNQK